MRKKLHVSIKTALALFMMLVSVTGWGQGTITIVPDKTTTGTTATSYITALTSFTAENINWVIKQWNPSTLQVRGNQTDAFAFYNTSAIPGTITKVTLNTSSGTFNNANIKLAVGSSNRASETTGDSGVSSTNKIEWTPSAGNTYFKIIFLSGATSGTAIISNITIEYSNLSTSAPTVTASSFSGTVGTSFSQQIIASETPSSYELVSGSTLPLGLSLNTSTGIISGTPTEAGTFTTSVTATNSIGTSSPVDIIFNVSKGSQNVILNDLNVYVGASNITLPATTNEGLAINYVSSNNSVASISGNILTVGDIGSASITASNIGNANYLAFNTTFDINVNFDSSVQPVANAATSITSNSFVANWDTIPSANSYNLDVYQSSGSLTPNVSVVGWTFENESNLANTGLTINNTSSISTNATGLTYTDMTSSGSNGYIATTSGGWNNGNNSKYWKINFSTLGITNIRLSSVQRSSNTGPKDFKLQYSLDDSSWTDVSGATVTVYNNFTGGILNNISLPIDCENKSVVYLRWIMTSNNSVNNGTVASGGTSAIDDIQVIGDQGSVTINYILQNQNVGNVTSYTVNNVLPNSTYYYKIRGVNGAVTTVDSNEVSVTTEAPITWDGSAWSNVTGPSTNDAIVIDGDYTGPSIEAGSVTVNPLVTLTVPSNGFVKTTDVVNNGTIVVPDNGNFIHTGTFTAGADSEFRVRKNTKPVKRLAYVNWSNPMKTSAQTIKAFSYGKLADGITDQSNHGTIDTRFFTYNSGLFTAIASPITTLFGTNGEGYLFRTPNDFTTTAQVFMGQFSGSVPNAGNVTYTGVGTVDDYQLVGNPYPSAISIADFFAANPDLDGSIYIWNSASEMDGNNQYSGNTYNVYSSGVGATPAGSINGYIPVGQGFFVKGATTVNFTDAMRVKDSNGLFSKSAGLDRFWLQLNTPSGSNPQLLMAFHPQGSLGVNTGLDAKMMSLNNEVLYTKVNGDRYVIDAHGNFQTNDRFNVFLNSTQTQNYTISVPVKEGVFQAGQSIYLLDKNLNVVTDLSLGNYSFTSEGIGEEDRFEVFFSNHALSTQDVTKQDEVQVVGNKGIVLVKSSKDVKSVKVYDMSGRLLAEKHGKTKTMEVSAKGNIYVLVNVMLHNGETVSKKVKL